MVLIVGLSLTSCTINTVDPGEEAFMFRPWGEGIDTSVVYEEGSQVIAMYNDLIVYNVLQQSRNYSSSVMEKNGMDIGVNIIFNYNPMKGKTSKLHLKHGIGYEESFIDAQVKGAIKDVIGRYTYEEIYSTKREALETELDEILTEEFAQNFVKYNFCQIADVDLPDNVKKAITAKETQKQANLKAKELELEQEYLANAKVKKAEGQKQADILLAEGKSQSIKLVQQQLARSPQYVELVKWEGYADGAGSPWGENNVFSVGSESGGVAIIKGLGGKVK